MTTRLTGLASGLDTESIITQLVSGHKTKVDSAKNEQKKMQWKKDAWSALNTKLYSFYTGALSKFQSAGSYKAKKVEATDKSGKVTVNASNSAVNGVHSLSVLQVASSAYLTSGSLKGNSYKTTSYKPGEDASRMMLSDLKDSNGYDVSVVGKSFDVSYKVTDADGNESTMTKTITANAGVDGSLQGVIDDMNQQLADSGIDMKVSYNASKGALQFTNNTAQAVKGTDEEGNEIITGYEGGLDYTVTASDEDSAKALGLSTKGNVVSQQTNDTGNNIATMNNAFNLTSVSDTEAIITGSTKLTDMGIADGTTYTIKVGTGDKQKEYNFTIDQTTTLSGLAKQFSQMGVNASFDAKQGRFFINSIDSGADYNFELSADNEEGLRALGLDAKNSTKEDARDAIVKYNGATFQQASNNFSLNGLNFTVNDVTTSKDEDGNVKDTPIKMTVSTDTDAIYNTVKDFIKEYNSLIEEMNKLYNAASAKDYKMLSDDDKEAMDEDEVKEWEDKIKSSLLRRDGTISTLLSTMRTTLNGSVAYTGTDGITKKYSLNSFGISTGTWSENGKLHIAGDPDDAEYSSSKDKLKAAIENNPDALINTLSTLGKNLYTSFQKAMKSNDYSSALTFYNDKEMDKQINSYEDKIDKLTEKMNKVEDRYYKQFAAMETAMAKLQATQSSFSSYFGG